MTKMREFYIHELLLEKLISHYLLLLPFLLAIVFLYTWLYKHNRNKNQPPSPPKLPFIGNLHQLGKAPHRSLQSLSRKYGDLMLLHLGSKPTLVVSSSNAAKEIMKTHDLIFSNRPTLKMPQILLYNGRDVAFSNYGEYWRQMKSICVLHLLNSKKVRSFGNIREEETAIMVEKIRGLSETIINLSDMIVTLTNDVVCRAAFGRKYRGKDGSKFVGLVEKFVELLGVVSIGDAMPWMSWIDRVNGLEGKAERVAKEVDIFLEGVLEEHLDSRSAGSNGDEGDGNDEKVKDFMDILVEVLIDDHTTGLSVDRESIKALILDMFAAGTETTFTLIEWAMSELLRHPLAMNKLQEEVRSTAHGKSIANENNLEGMKYLKAVIKETLRLHPPLPLLVSRESTSDIKLNSYEIKARTQVIINAWAIHRDPSVWEEPDEFYPERFFSDAVDFRGHDFRLIPFGAGRRMCPGVEFAVSNAELVLANLVNAFDWGLPDGAKGETLSMEESSGLSIHRRSPLLVVATPHSV